MNISIEKIDNGWIVTEGANRQTACLSELELLKKVLLLACGRSENFGGSLHGKIYLELDEPKRITK